MYLVMTRHAVEQEPNLAVNSRLLGAINEGDLDVYRFADGRFERLHAVSETRANGASYFAAHWRTVPVRPD